ncbi:hypothetical protein COT75_05435 [Candidatus Beckwithbacteria bacterium CG10_big_fil_rev_8_21_14_0_10_34_10]|uniref:inorganic diphosphatase n=1 Tax=Candidatus Beckwithbacteria bacterium CG10_big_fil_rev_8_21_14_0_10_34_10 TaxID=1974495 RepID=A0A2H0W7R7_9BACT|nr:MAG: hypothetical protein COT75_05435 [Candidatus Beckwithbacteria bacterium CG10_big_fil_rev_8_21_14_0_10_34_10]
MNYIIGHHKPDLDSVVSALALEYLFLKAPCFKQTKAKAVLASKANLETQTIFKKFKTSLPRVLKSQDIKTTDNFVLVDHNEISQRLKGIKDEMITNIFDHHKVSLNLGSPIFITTKPWGSSSTLVYWLMEITQVKPDKDLSSLMISAILSDTVGLKSPTTTKKDKLVISQLNKVAQLKNLDDLTLEIFKAKSSLKNLTKKEILTKDYKINDFKGKKVFINQIETAEIEALVKDTSSFLNELKTLKKEMKLNYAFCLLTNVLKVNSHVFCLKEDETLLKKAFPLAREVENGVFDLGPIMSRKKEVVPLIERAI